MTYTALHNWLAFRHCVSVKDKVSKAQELDMTPTATFRISPRDFELANSIVDVIRRDPSLCTEPVCVDVRDGNVTLRGTVSRYAAMIATCAAAEAVPGVCGVTSDLTVQIPGPLRRTDDEIRDAALAALKWKACLPPGSVNVCVRDGSVTLLGQVDWSYQKRLAEQVLEPLDGLTSICNKLCVSDRQVEMEVLRRIRTALQVAAQAQADAIEVEVRDGTVYLRGRLPCISGRAVACSAARGHPEVRRLCDELHVTT